MSEAQSEFGQNQWLVDDMYRQYREDPDSVSAEWRELFSSYTPGSADSADAASDSAAARSKGQGQATAQGSAGTSTTSTTDSSEANQQVHKAAARESVERAGEKAPSTTRPGVGAGATSDPKAAAPAAPPKRIVPRRTTPNPIPESRYSPGEETEHQPLRGAANAIVKNMNESLTLPTATTVRAVPAKLMMDNRIVINNHLARTRGGKISFSHIVGYAMVQAIKAYPNMNNSFAEVKGKPTKVVPPHINLGLAVDLKGKNGSRSLVVAAIKNTESMNFRQFLDAYDDIVKRSRDGKLTMDDFSGVTASMTNPGGIGTNHSVPRLTVGQGTIVGVGALQYPAQYEGTSEETLAELGVGKIMTLTSTYDHRVIQGAESGEFLKTIHQLLISDQLFDDIFEALEIPYEPIRWARDITTDTVNKDARVLSLIESYRSRGHLMADIDPLRFTEPGTVRIKHPDLDTNTHGLTLWDLDREFSVGGFAGRERMKLRDVLGVLRDAYCRKVGTEYTHILDAEEREWLRDRLEAGQPKPTVAQQKYILSNLNAAEAFETFLQTKYVGQKRFSLEGAESLIPLMDQVIDSAADHELDEVVIGMPHRGRLNVLANIVGKPYRQLFTEFEGNMDPNAALGSGDVKYHLGAEGTHIQMFGDNDIKVSLTANPSHLETVDPVLEGIVRAKNDLVEFNGEDYKVMPLMLHGDAAFIGQGVVAETLNISQLEGFSTGGTVHVIVNNQIGFTTSPGHGRSSTYCTDFAKAIGSPVFHVNGDDPEGCTWVAQLAVEYRQRFNKDVVIDLVCYRRRGHNEADDPSMTQPQMYEVIDNKRTVRKSYTDDLIGRGDITEKEAEAALRDYQGQLERVFNEVRELEKHPARPSQAVDNAQVVPKNLTTGISAERIAEIGDAFVSFPEDFTVHRRVKPVQEHRQKMSREGDIDWAFGELLAFGSLVQEGRTVRLAGEDSRRGTFTQRHAMMFDRKTSEPFSPLSDLAEANNGHFAVYDTALTEYAGVGFEYGYSVGNPEALVLWEAQFGDFVNGAQSIVDEYISSAEAKWGQRSGVVLLLPHGQEGMGPDHSSARVERFLQLCAESSMTVAHPSTPANYFHLLRRHALDGIQRPIIVLTPKSMLRNKAAVSSVEDFVSGRFQSVIMDPAISSGDRDPQKVTTMIFTAGKVYYELEKRREKDGRDDVSIVRLEQLYPIPHRRLKAVLDTFPNLEEIRWVQEEPANQGAWPFLALNLPEAVEGWPAMTRVSRRAMSSTATGIAKVHQVEQARLIDDAFRQ